MSRGITLIVSALRRINQHVGISCSEQLTSNVTLFESVSYKRRERRTHEGIDVVVGDQKIVVIRYTLDPREYSGVSEQRQFIDPRLFLKHATGVIKMAEVSRAGDVLADSKKHENRLMSLEGMMRFERESEEYSKHIQRKLDKFIDESPEIKRIISLMQRRKW